MLSAAVELEELGHVNYSSPANRGVMIMHPGAKFRVFNLAISRDINLID